MKCYLNKYLKGGNTVVEQIKKSSLELTRKHLEKIAKSKSLSAREILQGVKYSDGNIATVTDSHRALIINYEHETFTDSLINLRTSLPMDISVYPDVERVIPNGDVVPNIITIERTKIKEMLTQLRKIKKLKIKNIIINFEESADGTKCYLESIQTKPYEATTDIKLYLGSIEKIKEYKVTVNTDYFLNLIQFVKDTKEQATFKFGTSMMPFVCEGTLDDRFSYKYCICPVRIY